MEIYNDKIFKNYTKEIETLEKELKFLISLSDVNSAISSLPKGSLIASKLFSFIDSKYSSKIEGIYTGLYDTVNTGIPTKQENIIKPLVEALLYKDKKVTMEMTDGIAEAINVSNDQEQRWLPSFGIYGSKGKVYAPSIDKKYVRSELEKNISKASKVTTVIDSIVNHIWFEKIHPYFDGNGRIGRLIMNKSISSLFKTSDVYPLSWAIFKNKQSYYDSFDIENNAELNKQIRVMLDIFINMADVMCLFFEDLNIYIEKNMEEIMNSSTKMTEDTAIDILLNLQTKASDLVKNGYNPRTVNSIFDKIVNIDFNEMKLGREKLWWNIELESIIEKHFNG